MIMRLTLLCHAATRAQREARFPGDDPAEPAGLAAAARLKTALDPFAAVASAPEPRAWGTAEMLGLPVARDPALRDLDVGTWTGRGLAEIHAADPAAALAWRDRPDWSGHGGESLDALVRRVGHWLDAHDHPGHHVAVTHASVVRAAIVHVLAAPAAAFWRLDVEPLARADLRRNGSRWTLREIRRP